MKDLKFYLLKLVFAEKTSRFILQNQMVYVEVIALLYKKIDEKEIIVDDGGDWIYQSVKKKRKLKENSVHFNTKQKPYVCDKCDNKFKDQFNLTEHAKTHIEVIREQEQEQYEM